MAEPSRIPCTYSKEHWVPQCSLEQPLFFHFTQPATMGSEDGQQQDIQKQVLQQTLTGLSSSKDGAESAEACCVICLSEISEACTAKPCAHHNFDFLCLASWLQLKTTCPLCKCEISEIHYDFTDQRKSWKTFKVPKIGLERTNAEGSAETPSDSASITHRRLRGRSRFGGPSYRGRFTGTHLLPVSSDPDLRAREVLARRRHVYRNRLYSLHVGSSPASRYRDISPQLFNTDSELQSRARAWLRRELQVFEFLHDDNGSHPEDGNAGSEDGRRRRQNNAEFVLEYVIAILKTVDIQESSGHAEELLSDFLGRENCRVFLHELRNFLRSPYSMDAWDRHVQYGGTRAASVSSDVTRRETEDQSQPEHGQRRMGDRYRPSDRRVQQRGARQYRSRGSLRRRDGWRPGGTNIG